MSTPLIDPRSSATHQQRVARYNAAIVSGDPGEIRAAGDDLLYDIWRRIVSDDRYVERTREGGRGMGGTNPQVVVVDELDG